MLEACVLKCFAQLNSSKLGHLPKGYVPLSEFSGTAGTGSLQKQSELENSLAEGLLSSI